MTGLLGGAGGMLRVGICARGVISAAAVLSASAVMFVDVVVSKRLAFVSCPDKRKTVHSSPTRILGSVFLPPVSEVR